MKIKSHEYFSEAAAVFGRLNFAHHEVHRRKEGEGNRERGREKGGERWEMREIWAGGGMRQRRTRRRDGEGEENGEDEGEGEGKVEGERKEEDEGEGTE